MKEKSRTVGSYIWVVIPFTLYVLMALLAVSLDLARQNEVTPFNLPFFRSAQTFIEVCGRLSFLGLVFGIPYAFIKRKKRYKLS